MIEQFTRYIQTHHLFEKGSTLLVGVSGGVDSMVLIDLLCQIQDEWNLKLIVAHFNYKLRGDEADQDEALVKAYCETFDLIFESTFAETQQIAEALKQGIQETARKLRYSWFDELKAKYQADRIVLAHHSDDNIETIYFHLTRGTGIAGLRGMKPRNEKEVVRPFLSLTKEQILDYARAHQVVWREDKSNQKTDYTRNLIRIKVLPILKQINPSISENFEETHSRLLGLEALVADKIASLRKEHCVKRKSVEQWNTDWIQDDDMSLMLLSEMLKTYGFSFRDTQDIHEAIQRPMGQMYYSEDYHLNVTGSRFEVEAIDDSPVAPDMLIMDGEEEVDYGGWKYQLEYHPIEAVSISSDPDKAFLDYDQLQFPLTLRKWKRGDRMQPFGMYGNKKISDILIDQKISNIRKDKTHVLVSGNRIIWLCGVRIGHPARVTNQTENVLVMTRR
jgi:tRNA(Ile)-lysidine synthase